ncbi:unnamed protein product [Bursaphelenchus okinawaensis]|uniref:Uncharacterized protein n=1 Tax=Bursaphelenchus okinawaensis TaxID=465554 RepID=A0A811LDP6_9BILA|nr:unnamed protein product [Bursaphelenchus okinawaensis]CAG9123365.1 unnamed protein product [Bursaphelenchus okinawaensis]
MSSANLTFRCSLKIRPVEKRKPNFWTMYMLISYSFVTILTVSYWAVGCGGKKAPPPDAATPPAGGAPPAGAPAGDAPPA